MSSILELTHLQGNWIVTKNVCLIQKNKTYIYKEEISINNYNNENYKKYEESENTLYFSKNRIKLIDINYTKQKISVNNIHIISKNVDVIYKIQYFRHNHFKVQYKINDIECYEHVYSINNNVKLSIAILMKSKKYIATMFTSYIKKF
uniref:Uncharacterized protein n=1 Tax=Sphondylothamnion multifidum TaxID=193186 RepID=A0A4D6WZ84_9FLOR|nr:hypothetical protein [Sphondylothamnion multifidum]